MRILVLIFIAMVAVGVAAFRSPWGQQREPSVPYENAAESLPVLEAVAEEGVTFLRAQDWCQAYADDREKWANTLSGTCTLEDGYKLFDDAAERRYHELRGMLDALPYPVHYVELQYGDNGDLRRARLSMETVNPFRRDFLGYDPGYVLPAGIPGEVVNHRIDTDWYYSRQDWN